MDFAQSISFKSYGPDHTQIDVCPAHCTLVLSVSFFHFFFQFSRAMSLATAACTPSFGCSWIIRKLCMYIPGHTL